MAREIDRLRAEVARATKLASAKIARTRKSTGANVEGSQFDPRRDAGRVSRYNSKQLRNYLAELDSFRDRKVQFVSGAKGAPIPAHLARRYESVMNTYNAKASGELAGVSGVKLPGGMTIGEREKAFSPNSRFGKSRSFNRPRGVLDIPVASITSADAIVKLEKSMRGKLADAHASKTVRAQRFQLGEMLNALGEGDLVSMYAELDDKQFNMLWNYTDFADNASGRYEAVKNMSIEQEAATRDEFRNELIETFNWARGQKLKA